VRFTIDSNVLVYSIDLAFPEKSAIARRILAAAPFADAVLTAQALGEFVKVVRRKFPNQSETARAQANDWAQLLPVVSTTWPTINTAAVFAQRYRLQFWDSVIWQSARSVNAEILLSEDLQDGLTLEGMTVLNPFDPANSDRVEALLQSSAAP
jgi:predicted nucleic acid-binding protein